MKTLIIGASTNPQRYSNKAIQMLREYEHETVAFAIRDGQVGDVTFITNLDGLQDIDTISLYIGPTHQPAYYERIVEIAPRRVIFNPGTENPELYDLLTKNGISYEASCTLVMLRTGVY